MDANHRFPLYESKVAFVDSKSFQNDKFKAKQNYRTCAMVMNQYRFKIYSVKYSPCTQYSKTLAEFH